MLIQHEETGRTMVIEEGEAKPEGYAVASLCPYIKAGAEGTAHCELAETGIKVFEQRAKQAEQLAQDWQHEFNMYRSAWIRELGGKVIPKTHDVDALVLTTRTLREERDRLRAAIAKHRSQKADDRCIEDDDELYAALGDGVKCDRRVGDKAAMLANCKRFIERRCEGGHWPSYAEVEAERDEAREGIRAAHKVLDEFGVKREDEVDEGGGVFMVIEYPVWQRIKFALEDAKAEGRTE
jgi:HEPN domain-containing protein